MDEFYARWFGGFESALTKLDFGAKESLFAECGKACSASYTEKIYREAWEKCGNFSELFRSLSEIFEDLSAEEIVPEKTYDIIYRRCLCPFYADKLIKSGELCECSRQSLLHNLNALGADTSFTADIMSSVLRGDGECRLRVNIFSEKKR